MSTQQNSTDASSVKSTVNHAINRARQSLNPESKDLSSKQGTRQLGYLLSVVNIFFLMMYFLISPLSLPWFIYPLYLSGLLYGVVLLGLSKSPSVNANKRLYLNGLFSSLTSLMLVVTNEHLGSTPWSITPVLLMGLGLSVHYILEKSQSDAPTKLLYTHATAYVFGNVLLFSRWAYSSPRGFPYFLLTLPLFGALLGGHYMMLSYIEQKLEEKNSKKQ
ncbi:hypothetical protein AKO1_012247 [Acrasis kona]|uniref:Uncharacterized protein n=1 Tax=Acrasis kona TaxID=1008807 RepID=A0AAW2Z9B8_9EUKA